MDKEMIIKDFENRYWEISEPIKDMLLNEPDQAFLVKICEWIDFAKCGGKVVF
ncbi:hypothetical protein [Streptococcus parauberis]|uniref:hypothetical protein n=1 Tax=Streptococcus parauberis TaxID=1348 RepID=UPI000C5A5C2A|nr:hypothetical protein [Streptococcus parauberis]PIA83690.1 hypothetical protein ADO07_01558 [Streptococcus parauberis]